MKPINRKYKLFFIILAASLIYGSVVCIFLNASTVYAKETPSSSGINVPGGENTSEGDEGSDFPEEPSEPEVTPSPAKGSYENPYNAKKAVTITFEDRNYQGKNKHVKGQFKVKLKTVIKGKKAASYLKKLSSQNPKAPSGSQWIVLSYKITYKKGTVKSIDPSYLINPYSNFYDSKCEKITSFKDYKPNFGKKEFTINILRVEIPKKKTKNLCTALLVKNNRLPVSYRICTGYEKKDGKSIPVYEWFKISG